MKQIHINCDLGEGAAYDAALLPFISACNIACGGHAGDAASVSKTIQLALANNVEIGAHPSYPDRENFGRKAMQISAEALKASIREQVNLVQDIAREQGTSITHVKPHGALYNLAAKEESLARLIIDTLVDIEGDFALYAPFGSVISKLAENKMKVIYEAFADRNYKSDLSLVPRTEAKAVIKEKEEVFEHVFAIYSKNLVRCKNGEETNLKADTFCLHSDTEDAVEILKFLNEKMQAQNIKIAKI